MEGEEVRVALLDVEGAKREAQSNVVNRVRLCGTGHGRAGNGDLNLWSHAVQTGSCASIWEASAGVYGDRAELLK